MNETDTTRKDLQDALLLTILQFAKEQNAKGLVQKLMKETAVLFDTEYFRNQISKGEWDTVESYLMKFTRIEDNKKSAETFFLLKRQKFLEALADNDVEEAENVLESELQAFNSSQKKLLENLSSILSQKKPRGNKLVSEVIKDLNASRTKLADEAVKLIRENCKFHRKLEPPKMKKSRLLNIIHQSIAWQHSKCENPREETIVRSLYIDHSCDQSDETPQPSSVPILLLENIPAPQAASPLYIGATTAEIPPNEETVPNCIDIPSIAEDENLICYYNNLNIPTVKRKSPASKKTKKSGRASKRQRDEEGSNNSQANETVQRDPNPQQEVHLSDELPLDVVMFLRHDSHFESLDFHPSKDSLLLCGTAAGDIILWELSSKKKLVQKSFRFWDLDNISTCKKPTQEANKVKWNSDGVYFAVAFKECLVHVYSYLGNGNLKEHTEINAHQGLVHDIAFTNNGDEPLVITCGDDETIKVWEALTGDLRFCIYDLKDRVCSVYPQQFHDQPAIFTGCEGFVKIWLYNDKKCKKTIRLPKSVVPCIAYSADGARFFAGGSSDGNESCIVEFSSTGRNAIKQEYDGLATDHEGYVYYDIAKGKYLAAVHAFKIKFWNMDDNELLKEIDAGGALSDSSYIKFNKEGSLLAVTTKDNGIIILANADGTRFLQAKEVVVLDAPSAAGVTERILGSCSKFDGMSRMTEEPTGLSDTWSLKVINDCRQCFSKIIPNEFSKKSAQVSCLGYTNLGRAILVLGSNGEHKLWEWPKTAENPNGKATPTSEPKLFQAPEQKKMVNDVGANPEGLVSCFALPKKRHYVLSASGGRVSVYDIKTFKNIAKIMKPRPAATALAIHPKDSNTFLFGMKDSSIQIYNIRTKQVLLKLDGHTNRVTGISFSDDSNLLVSSDADCQLYTWSIEEQKMLKHAALEVPHGQASDTRVQFHKDQRYLLVVHKTQIATYEAPELSFVKKWTPEDADILITHAAYSCDCESIFVTFRNGSVGVLNASSLNLKCRINPVSFIPPPALSQELYPLVVAAHPSEPNQFALGLSDGTLVVLEPKEGTWGTPCPDDNEDRPGESPGIIDLELLVWDEGKEDI